MNMNDPRTAEAIAALRQNIETSVEELQTALLEYLAPDMPSGIVLDGVEVDSPSLRCSTWVSGLDTVRDLEAIAEAFRSDVERHTDPEGKTNLAVWVNVAGVRVRFELYFWTEEAREAALSQYP